MVRMMIPDLDLGICHAMSACSRARLGASIPIGVWVLYFLLLLSLPLQLYAYEHPASPEQLIA
jgi:hypothetical protein